mgnify:FL=1
MTLYTTAPNLAALQYLSDRAMGKVPQRYEITGDEGGPVEVVPWMPPAGYVIEGKYEVIDGTEDEEGSPEVFSESPSTTDGRAQGREEGTTGGVFEVAVAPEAVTYAP